MSQEVKNVVASIKAKLMNIAKRENKQFESLLLLYFQERLLYRLSVSEYKDKFILKGGLLLFSISGFTTRPTIDIDFLGQKIANDLENLKEVFKDICCINSEDGIEFDVDSIIVEEIMEEAEYSGTSVKINAYLGKAVKQIKIDIGFGDIIVPKPVEINYPILLENEAPNIQVYSIESVIAEKFEAMISKGIMNSRMKDFYDIYYLLNNKNFDGRVLQEAIFETIQRRGTPIERDILVFEIDFAEDKDKNAQWKAFIRKIGRDFDLTFKVVIDSIKVFLKPIYESITNEVEFLKQWDYAEKKWVRYKE